MYNICFIAGHLFYTGHGVIPCEINWSCHPPSPNFMKFGTEATFHEKITCSKFQLKISYGSRDIDTWSQALFWAKILSAAKLSRQLSIHFVQNLKKFTSKLHETLYLTIFWY